MSAIVSAIASVAANVNGDFYGFVCTVLLSGISGALLYLRQSTRRTSITYLVALYTTLVSLALNAGGGLEAPSIIVLPVLPAVASSLLGRRHALAWTLVVLVTLAGLAMVVGPNAGGRVPESAFFVFRGLCLTCATIFVAVSVMSYERDVLIQTAELDEAHRDALAAHANAEDARVVAERANQAKTRFLASMSHELRTPLTAVVGIAEVMDRDELEEGQRERLKTLTGASQTLLGLIDDILDIARAESGQLVLQEEPLDLFEEGAQVHSILASHADLKGVTLTHKHEGPPIVYGDRLRLRQIMMNLVGNAIRFTDTGTIDLETTGRPGMGASEYAVTIVVRDSGVGIPSSQHATIFEAFAPAGTQPATGPAGTGLGLSITREIAQLMGGRVSVSSVPGEGSVFTVFLQLEPASLPSRTSMGENTPASKVRVLLAEDNPTNQAVLKLMLEGLQCTVDAASDGAEAVAAVSQNAPYDLILMDCMMPVLDGLEATRLMRERGTAIPIVALTANATAADRQA